MSYKTKRLNNAAILFTYLLFLHLQISKSNVVDDMVDSNRILYEPKEKPDHCVSTDIVGCETSFSNKSQTTKGL